MIITAKLRDCCFVNKTLLLLIVFTIGLIIRVYHVDVMALKDKHFYSSNYEPVLYYMLGKGMNKSDASASVNHAKVWQFLNAKVDELDISIVENVINENPNIKYFQLNQQYQTFAYYVAAYVWKIFGISWSNLFYFYSFLSMLSGLALFFVVRKITHSYWAGTLTLIIYALAVPDIVGSAWSIRDASPVWFFSFSLFFLFVLTGIYKNRWFNYLSYYLLGVVVMIGIGWRSDVLLFFPIILLYLIINFFIKYKKEQVSTPNIFIFVSLFFIGSYSILNLHEAMSSKNQPSFGFMHIAQYGEHERSKIGMFENNFQNQFSDSMTYMQVKTYQEASYPNKENVIYMKGDYGQYCLELYLIAFKHNFYQWTKSYPNYLYQKFILSDAISGRYISSTTGILQDSWKFFVLIGLIGGILLFIVGIYRKEIILFMVFIFYYSLIYWAILPMSKHIMIIVVPISILGGLSIYFILSLLFNPNYRKKVTALINKKNILIAISTPITIICLYLIILGISNYISTKSKSNFISEIEKLNNNSLDITSLIDKNINILDLDLSKYNQIGLLVEFEADKEGLASITQNFVGGSGQRGLVTNQYKIDDDSNKHFLFIVCTKMIDSNIVNIILPSHARIKKVDLLPLDKWNGVWYTTIYNDNKISAGSKSIKNILKYDIIPNNLKVIKQYNFNTSDFIKTAYKNKNNLDLLTELNEDSYLWQSTSSADHLWNRLKNISVKKNNNTRNYLSIRFKKNSLMFSGDLKIRLHFYDKLNRLVFNTMAVSTEYSTHNDKDYHELLFDITGVSSTEALKYRLYFNATKPGKYKVPKQFDIRQIDIKINQIKL